MRLKSLQFRSKKLRKFGKNYTYSIADIPEDLPEDYKAMLTNYNGGFTEDEFFHFFGLTGPCQHNVVEWNKADLWKGYFELDESRYVFAEDIMGGQYFFKRGGRKNAVYLLTPYTGIQYFMADRFGLFVRDVVDDSDNVCSEHKELIRRFFDISKEKRGLFEHVSFKVPIFFEGVSHDIDNLEFCDSIAYLRICGQLWSQLHHLPKGTVVRGFKYDKKNSTVRLII